MGELLIQLFYRVSSLFAFTVWFLLALSGCSSDDGGKSGGEEAKSRRGGGGCANLYGRCFCQ